MGLSVRVYLLGPVVRIFDRYHLRADRLAPYDILLLQHVWRATQFLLWDPMTRRVPGCEKFSGIYSMQLIARAVRVTKKNKEIFTRTEP
jgi:hypothetical protein